MGLGPSAADKVEKPESIEKRTNTLNLMQEDFHILILNLSYFFLRGLLVCVPSRIHQFSSASSHIRGPLCCVEYFLNN